MIIPVMLLVSAAQPVYRLGAFIETTHAERLDAAARAHGEPTDVPDKPAEERIPQRSWPVELVALFPAGIAAGEQAFRAPAGERLFLEANSGTSAFCPPVTPTAYRFTRLVRAERSMADSFGVVAHPIHTHAPPPVL